MIWYRESEIPDTKNFIIKRELLAEFKLFCRNEFLNQKNDIYDDLDKKVERNIFLNEFDEKDKEYLKFLLGLVRANKREFKHSVLEELMSDNVQSFPPATIISHNENNFFVLKKACVYLSLSKPESQRFTWQEVLSDITRVTADDFFVSLDFKEQLDGTKQKIRKVLSVLDYINREDEQLEMSILVKPLLATNLVLKIPPNNIDLFKELIEQEIIHPSMKLPTAIPSNSKILLEHMLNNPQPNTSWFIKESILEGDAWIDYEQMYKHYNSIYDMVYEDRTEAAFAVAKNIFEQHLEVIKIKHEYNQLKQTTNPQTNEDLEEDSGDFKL